MKSEKYVNKIREKSEFFMSIIRFKLYAFFSHTDRIGSLTSALLMLTIFTIPFGNLLRFHIFDGLNILASDILLGMLFFLTVPASVKYHNKVLNCKVLRIVLIFCAIGLLSLIFNVFMRSLTVGQFLISGCYLARFLVYSNVLIVTGLMKNISTHSLLKKLTISGCASVLLGFVQYFLYDDLRNLRYIGWDEHLHRLFGTFLDPNFTGAFFVLVALMLLYQTITNRGMLNKALFLSAFIVTIIGAILTYSRGTYLTLFVSLVVFLFLLKEVKLLVLCGVVVVASFILLPLNREGEGVNLLRTASIGARMREYDNAVTVWRSSPIFGVGFNSYRYAQRRFHLIDEMKWEENNAGAGVPNSFLFVLATTGVAGLYVYGYLWAYLMKRIIAQWKKYPLQTALLVSSIVGILVHSLFDNTLFYPYIMIWIFLLVGMRNNWSG